MGVMERAVKRDARSVIETTKESCLNIIPVKPLTNTSGTKTTTMVKVDAVTAILISLVPEIALALILPPRSICRTIFSRTTIPLSTTMPEAIIKDRSEIVLIVYPKV
ncbi:hypothetical protein ES708_28651 [subsurface metagenome]